MSGGEGITRRAAVGYLSAFPFVLAFEGGPAVIERAARRTREALAVKTASGQEFVPAFFTDAEWTTVRILVDLVIPRDDRSGSATEAGVPEYMDFVLTDTANNRERMRTGLTWLDAESTSRFGRIFAEASAGERTAILDDIAWPDRAPEELADGVRFFNMFRDMTASGFYTSPIGIDDLQYIGNVPVASWEGCPDEACQKLGVSYEEQWPR